MAMLLARLFCALKSNGGIKNPRICKGLETRKKTLFLAPPARLKYLILLAFLSTFKSRLLIYADSLLRYRKRLSLIISTVGERWRLKLFFGTIVT